MNSNLGLFNFEGKNIRVLGTPARPLWIAVDTCTALGIKNYRDAVLNLDDDEKDTVLIPDSLGRMRKVLAVTEAGLYALISQSDKPEAKQFKRWINHEVLPSVRETGGYSRSEYQNDLMSQLNSIQQQNQQMMAALIASYQQQSVELQRQVSEVQELTKKLHAIDPIPEDKLPSIKKLSPPIVEASALSTRAKINRLVRDYAVANRLSYREVWRHLYAEFRDRYHVDLRVRARNKKNSKPLDICEDLGLIEQLYAVASEVLLLTSTGELIPMYAQS
jgi:prophage antirepressor-like protein